MILLLWACQREPQPAPSEASQTVRIGLNWFAEPEFGGFYEALLSGAYKQAGLNVSITPGGPGVPVLEMLTSNQLDVAISGADDLLVKRAKGLDAIAVFAGFQDSPVGLMAHAASGLGSIRQIQGGTIAIEAGSPFQQFLWSSLGWEGKVAMVPTTGGLGAFAADPDLIQQGYVTSEPCSAEAEGLAVSFMPAREAGWNPYASLAVVRGGDANTPWVEAFARVSRAGWEAYLRSPDRANAEIAKVNPDMTPERLTCITARQAPYVVGTDGVGAMTTARWKDAADALNKVGQTVQPDGAWKR